MSWLNWIRRIQAIAQTGLAYTKDPFDRERLADLRQIAVEMAAALPAEPPQRVQEAFAGESGYATPKVDVRAVVFHDGKILMVREKAEGLWSLPGGWADIGETPGEIAAREVLEEAGYVVKPRKLLAVLDRDRQGHPPSLWAIYKIFIQCELTGGTAQTSIETDAVGWFDRNALPPLSLARVTAAQIARMFTHLDQPDLPADFD